MTAFGAGGYYGLDIGLSAKVIGMTLGGDVKPYGGLICYGSLSVSLFVIYAELRLEGQILDLAFPTHAEISFAKFPLDVG